MSKVFEVSFSADPIYQVEAESEEDAIRIAENFFYEYLPHVEAHEVKGETENEK